MSDQDRTGGQGRCRGTWRSWLFPGSQRHIPCLSLRAARGENRGLVANDKNESDAALVAAVNRDRSAFVKHYFGVDGPTRSTCDLMINTATGEDSAISTILTCDVTRATRKEVVDNLVDLTLQAGSLCFLVVLLRKSGKGRRCTSWPLSKSIVWLATGELNVPTVNVRAHWPAARSAFC